MYLCLSVSACLCLCICLFVSLRLVHCHHQMISFQKIYGLYGLEHHIVEINGDVTDAGRTDERRRRRRRTREDRATQPMDAGWLSFAINVLDSYAGRKENGYRLPCYNTTGCAEQEQSRNQAEQNTHLTKPHMRRT